MTVYMADPPQSRSTPLYHAHVCVRRLPDLKVVAIDHPEECERIAARMNAGEDYQCPNLKDMGHG
jgi:hypothetical protein